MKISELNIFPFAYVFDSSHFSLSLMEPTSHLRQFSPYGISNQAFFSLMLIPTLMLNINQPECFSINKIAADVLFNNGI